MGQKAITIYTPDDAPAHIYAEDDAQVHRGLIGGSGILLADLRLACTVVNENTVSLASGVYSNQGYLLVVQGGTTQTLEVESGTAGTFRKDLIVAHFTRGGGDAPDTHVFQVIKGLEASSAAGAVDPTLVQGDLVTGGAERMEAIYRINVNGTTISGVDRVANYIGNVYQ